MTLLVENSYTQKLYKHIACSASKFKMIPLESLTGIESGARIIVDEIDLRSFLNLAYDASEIIVLGDAKGDEARFRFISKYQSYKNIQSLIFSSEFPMIFLTSSQVGQLSEEFIKAVASDFDSDYIFSLNFNSESHFSLYDFLTSNTLDLVKGERIEVITNIRDFCNPPIKELSALFNKMRSKGSLLICSTPFKGALDWAILELSDTVILIEDELNAAQIANSQMTLHPIALELRACFPGLKVISTRLSNSSHRKFKNILEDR